MLQRYNFSSLELRDVKLPQHDNGLVHKVSSIMTQFVDVGRTQVVCTEP